MYTVEIERQCGCFKRSDFEAEKSFDNQQDAYNYANIASEIMNEDFCSKHNFFAQRTENDGFVIRVADAGQGGGGCGSSCGCS